jgi:NDP-sugar pyrophosphorylase family protein
VICVGYRGQQIQAALGERQQGVAISYSFDGPQLDGTLGAIRRALPLLGERFLVLYGDTYLRMDYAAAVRIWQASERPALMAVLRNEGRWDTSNAVYADGMIARYRKADPSADMQWIDYGLGGLTVEALSRVAADERDLALLYTRLADGGELCGYEVAERFYEIGTPQAMAETDHFLGSLAREA